MTVLAHYSDGTTRGDHSLTVFQSSNSVSAAVDEKGLVTADKEEEAFVMARFNVFTVGIQVVVIPEDLKYKRPETPVNNYYDSLVHDKLHKLASPPRVFVRTKCSSVASLSTLPVPCPTRKPTMNSWPTPLQTSEPN